ncbi:MAG TPA: hypothetical protein VHX37_13880 [Acidobacteriaceae bacterium]|jgi:hypothetical protein|nr:hypothetical protein [Acidobacteriaceae bacterium]
MKYIGIVNMDKELRNAAQGMKTKLPVQLVIYESLRDYLAIQRRVARAFDIVEY